ncbi:MAG TPA: type IV pilus twitching motility protein PilT [Nitrospirae bacterium]|nr:twitching mobility protein [bacterium BMS3Abin10]GBE39971.1 twitching mobility protein [bacterium BMS3Bbin08]HDH50431.1 type IV pilus twitching motility protein PilT [Nitrospirota bacterium]HDK16660.1 type IV pilus twitching motility protein PilT [Nitrospirota bacterium]HDK82269.1 type IV pilus twitching motility protein PilT [Nitrospirota bacterium]
MATLYELLKTMIERGATDLHISTGTAPRIRIDGKLLPTEGPPLVSADTKALCYSILTDAQKHKFEEHNELDLSFGVKGLSRFRANIFMQRGAVAGAFRAIPFNIKTFIELGLPDIISELTKKPRGLILVTGPTGCGKSTTLATMIDRINTERQEHIITVEDPIEYLHAHKQCLINQREVNADTDAFKTALKYVLRQDPDIVLIGEMRDLETIEAALTVSETGHLTLATLHTNSAVQTINRVIDVFPPYQQEQVRVQLSFVLEAVISQQLIAKKSGFGRVLAVEILVPTAAIRNLIREDKVHQIYSMMQTGQSKFGMQTMNQSLFDLYSKGLISYDDALGKSSVPDEMLNMMQRAAVTAKRR